MLCVCACMQGATVLIMAAGNGHEEVVRVLADRDPALLGETDNFECTPVHIAAWNRHWEVVNLLAEKEDPEILGAVPLGDKDKELGPSQQGVVLGVFYDTINWTWIIRDDKI